MIIVRNLSDNLVFHHSLIILSGETDKIEQSEIFISVNNEKEYAWPVIQNSFRGLVELVAGENVILLCCGTQTKVLRLTYEKPERTHFIRLVYIVCSDSSGCFQGPKEEDCTVRNARSRISFAARVIQSITAEKVHECGLARRTFSLEEDETAKPVCHVFHSKLTVAETHTMNEQALWDHFAMELMYSQLQSRQCKFLAFLSSTRYVGSGEGRPEGHLEVRSRTLAHVALGGGGLALCGTGCLYTWPSGLDDFRKRIEDCRPVDYSQYMDDSCNRGQMWSCYVSSLGATLHELAHTLDLGHAAQGIMGLGFHQLQQVLQVSSHRECCVCSRNAHFHEKLSPKENKNFREALFESCSDGPMKPKLSQWIKPCIHCPDGPNWSPSSARILYYHKWFQVENSPPEPVICEVTFRGWVLRSAYGLVVAELRDPSGLVLAYWHPSTADISVKSVYLPKGHLAWNTQTLVAEDAKGNLLKLELTRSPLMKTLGTTIRDIP